MTVRLRVAVALCSLSVVAASTPRRAPRPAGSAGLFPGLGSHHHAIATGSAAAQKFFDQGLILLYGFNHAEAIRSFQHAATLDPKAPMPHWGTALALGSNYNDPEPAAERLKKAYDEAEKALTLAAAPGGSEVERSYAEALSKRYSSDPKADAAELGRAYNAAMRDLTRRYPDDLDAATLFAESGMNLHPWKLWNPDGTPAEGTPEIVATLESVLKRDPSHPGANHYYIHAVEASPDPARALPSAMRLETLVPAAGHLVHMPAHIFMRTGDYRAAEKSNADAAEIDRAYIRATGAKGMYLFAYYDHNLHFESAAAAMAGRYAVAKKAAAELYSGVLPAVPEMQILEGYLLQPTFVSLRFRKWNEIAKIPDPGDRLPLLRAIRLFARGVAAAAGGDVRRAEAERAAFEAARGAAPPGAMAGMLNSAASVLGVATPLLDARIAEARGDRGGAVELWRKAVAAQDALAYDEPPPWYYPVRESLGAALLRNGEAKEAAKVFREDLDRNPRNGRSLFGLAESLKALDAAADERFVRQQFETAWKDADTKLKLEDL